VVYHQAHLCELKDRPDEALRLYRRWGELRPERWDSVLRAAECWMDMGRYLDAVHEVQRGLERYPDNPELFSHLAQLYIRTDSRPEAARLCDRWSLVDPTSGRPEWVRGQLAEKALRNDEAVRWYEAAVRKNPEFGTYHAALGAALASQPTPERLRRARAELEQATALDPMALFHYQLGLVLQQLGDGEGARRAFLRALDRDSDRLDAYAGLMTVARRAGRPGVTEFFTSLEQDARDRQRVETAARQNLSVHPRDARAQAALAQSLLRRGELAAARNHLAIAAEQPDGAGAQPLLRRVERLLSVL
jgi:tetratricopeptide (TPR) repeat protein